MLYSVRLCMYVTHYQNNDHFCFLFQLRICKQMRINKSLHDCPQNYYGSALLYLVRVFLRWVDSAPSPNLYYQLRARAFKHFCIFFSFFDLTSTVTTNLQVTAEKYYSYIHTLLCTLYSCHKTDILLRVCWT